MVTSIDYINTILIKLKNSTITSLSITFLVYL